MRIGVSQFRPQSQDVIVAQGSVDCLEGVWEVVGDVVKARVTADDDLILSHEIVVLDVTGVPQDVVLNEGYVDFFVEKGNFGGDVRTLWRHHETLTNAEGKTFVVLKFVEEV